MDPYVSLQRTQPERFTNATGGIEILTRSQDVEAAAAAIETTTDQLGVVYADRYITVVRDPVRFPDGRLGGYVRVFTTSGRPGAVILPLLGDAIVLVEHYRHATRAWHLEAPRGFGDPEAAVDTATRELGEEIGAAPVQLIALGVVFPDTGLLADPVPLYAARIAKLGALDHGEGIRRTVTLAPGEAAAAIQNGRINDGFTISVLTRAHLHGLTTLHPSQATHP